MPLIEFRGFDSRFEDDAVAADLIERLTKAVADQFGQEVADDTQVIIEGVRPSRWGFGGKVRALPPKS